MGRSCLRVSIILAFLSLFLFFGELVETDKDCWAEDHDHAMTPVSAPTEEMPNYNAVHVSNYFTFIFRLILLACIIDIFREFLTLLIICRILRAKALKKMVAILKINYFVQFFGIVMIHVFRLRHSGRVCSGDFLAHEDFEN